MKFGLPVFFYGLMLFGKQVAACLYLVFMGDLSAGGLFTALLDSLPK